jgi:hypothetical protein
VLGPPVVVGSDEPQLEPAGFGELDRSRYEGASKTPSALLRTAHTGLPRHLKYTLTSAGRNLYGS